LQRFNLKLKKTPWAKELYRDFDFRQGTTFYPELAKGSRAVNAASQCGFSR
jgi:hypothetical protein